MTLPAGTRFGPYEIQGALGAGGMGEVYRARDMRLDRVVALKVLPVEVGADSDRRSRFEREAKLLAALNHPHIAQIYGFEELGTVDVLVMELVEGPTLADRLTQGAIPIPEALLIARQIAEALEAAHEAGIIHRDLKPANVKVKRDGTVKVLDFGLAKAIAQADDATSVIGNASTIPPATTGVGLILGTAAYMSPEQAKAQAVDHRSDVWSFGCVLFELLAGRPPFSGSTTTEVLSEILKSEPNWSWLPEHTPSSLRRVIQRCLRKDPRMRLHDIGDARIDLEDVVQPEEMSRPRLARSALVARVAPWLLTALAAAGAVWTTFGARPIADTGASRPVVRVDLGIPTDVDLYMNQPPFASISPDDSQVVFSASRSGTRRVYLRRLDQNEPSPIPGTELATACFFSPDGRSVGFFSVDLTLRRLTLDGRALTVIATGINPQFGASWGANDVITFTRDDVLWEVPASGGSPKAVSTLDVSAGEILHAWPTAIGDGHVLLFTVLKGDEQRSRHIEALDVVTGTRTKILDQASFPLVIPGHLVFFRDDSLYAVNFDQDRLETRGNPIRTIEDLALDATGAPLAVTSARGSLLYVSTRTASKRLTWISRAGVDESATDAERLYQFPRLSADGHRIVVQASGSLWLFDVLRSTFTRLGRNLPGGSSYPIWTPSGNEVIFRSMTGLYSLAVDGDGTPHPIPETSVSDFPSAVSPDGRTLLITRQTGESSGDVYAISLDGAAAPRALVKTPAYDGGAVLSPDGRWLAYASVESGRSEVLVRPYPALDRRLSVWAQGGTHPLWRRDGRELFFREGSSMYAVDVRESGNELSVGQPKRLFTSGVMEAPSLTIANYDVSVDGQRFLAVRGTAGQVRPSLVLNWSKELDSLTRR